MYLEAVTVCVGYDDFLAEIVPFNRPHLDRWVIVTTPEDKATRELCHRRGLECVATRDFYQDGAAFDKAKGIDHAFHLLNWRDWVLHLDGDVILPGRFRESLEDARLIPSYIYGVDRFSIRGWDKWQRLKASGYFDRYARSAHCNISFPENFPVGSRWADDYQGYVPIGFFQLFHRQAMFFNGVRRRRYAPTGHNDAARTDCQFALQWDRTERHLLPEVIVGHLEGDEKALPVGVNWCGRKTPRFGPRDVKSCPPAPNPS